MKMKSVRLCLAASLVMGLSWRAGAAIPCLSWSFDRTAYSSPGNIQASCTLQAPPGGAFLSLLWRPDLPESWTVSGTSGNGEPQCFHGEILFTGSVKEKIEFSYRIEVPAGETKTWLVEPEAEFMLDGDVYSCVSRADPVTIGIIAVPEPGTLGELAVFGAAWLLFLRRRKFPHLRTMPI